MKPLDHIKNTIEWLLQIEEDRQACELALTMARHLPEGNPKVSDFLAMVHYKAKSYQQAFEHARKTVALAPENIEAKYNLARCLHSVGESVKAEEEIKRVLRARPGWLDAHLDQALFICAQGRFDEAEKLLLDLQKRIPVESPHHNAIQFNLAWHLIRHGHLRDGMQSLSVGRKIRAYGADRKTFPRPKLTKKHSVSSKRVLLVGEAGAGDEIINLRFAKTIRDRGGSSIWVTNHGFESLFSRAAGIEKVVKPDEIQSLDYDYWAPAMDLFSILDLNAVELPNETYLQADPNFFEKWVPRIGVGKSLKVGLRWQGNPRYEQDLYRSVPFELFRKFFSLPETEFFSLQRDYGVEELSSLDPVADLSSELVSWEDTAAVISLLDVVITSCTSVAHLAGAMGKKTFLFTPLLPYYIWASPGEKSVWYPDVRLFRQKKPRDWSLESDEMLAELKAILKEKE